MRYADLWVIESATGRLPKGYIWAYASDLSAESIGRQVHDWYETRGRSRTAYHPRLPSLIASGNAVGIQSDSWLTLDTGEAHARAVQAHGPQARPVTGFWPTSRQFGWLILRLLHDIRARLPISHAVTGARFALDGYLPIDDCSDQDLYGQLGHYIYWH